MTEKRRDRDKKKIPPPPPPKIGGTGGAAMRQMATTTNAASSLESIPLARKILGLLECFPRIGQTLFRFDDGYEWAQDGDLLFLRSCQPEGDGECWSPQIKVTLANGHLSGLQGPVKKLNHKHLIALLLHDAVQKADLEGDNFSLEDLGKESLKDLLQKKPTLCGQGGDYESG